MTALHWAGLLVLVGVASGSPQSNYNLQDLNIEFEGEGLPEFATLDASVVELGEENEFEIHWITCLKWETSFQNLKSLILLFLLSKLLQLFVNFP